MEMRFDEFDPVAEFEVLEDDEGFGASPRSLFVRVIMIV